MIVRMGMLQVYSVISVVILDHDAESTVELRHGDGGGCPSCIIITCCVFVFWGCIWVGVVIFNYKVPFSIFKLHAFSCLVQKTRLTSSVQFFQLIFDVKYFFGGVLRAFKVLF